MTEPEHWIGHKTSCIEAIALGLHQLWQPEQPCCHRNAILFEGHGVLELGITLQNGKSKKDLQARPMALLPHGTSLN